MIPPVDLPIAHLSEDGRSQPLSEHLRNVAEKASKFAADFRAANWGYAAGLLHDDGKALVEFQKRIRGASIQVDHSTPGARFAVEEYGIPRGYGRLLAYCVAGHHTGLPDGADNGKQSSLEYRLAHSRLGEGYLAGELPVTLENPPIGRPPVSAEKRGFDASFFIRMLYSCLVDADFLDTESFFEPHRVALRGRGPALETLKGFLEDHLRTIAASASPTEVNRLRARILAECRASALLAPGLFSLTVPTGGGKTLSSMAFALDHAIRHGLRRVIYVIPYTSIIEQTARVFRDVFGADAVLEHHSNFVQESDDSDDEREQRRRLAAENWDAPVVVTTNVQFFESFFACRSSKARKLHNVAASVVILDEAQMLPVSVLSPTLEVIRELVEGYGSSVVLCTATQPALMAREEFKGGLTGAREMMGAPLDLEKAFRRVNEVNLGETGDAELVRRIREARECLCVVNTKKHARELFRTLEDQPGTFHLSAAMCPVHRSRVLGKAKDPEPGSIREALLEGKPCRVISTQLVEAGVDLDFPVVFRALAGVDSIVQAAGRCNREGKLADGGTLYIFSPEESAPPGLPAAERAGNGECPPELQWKCSGFRHRCMHTSRSCTGPKPKVVDSILPGSCRSSRPRASAATSPFESWRTRIN